MSSEFIEEVKTDLANILLSADFQKTCEIAIFGFESKIIESRLIEIYWLKDTTFENRDIVSLGCLYNNHIYNDIEEACTKRNFDLTQFKKRKAQRVKNTVFEMVSTIEISSLTNEDYIWMTYSLINVGLKGLFDEIINKLKTFSEKKSVSVRDSSLSTEDYYLGISFYCEENLLLSFNCSFDNKFEDIISNNSYDTFFKEDCFVDTANIPSISNFIKDHNPANEKWFEMLSENSQIVLQSFLLSKKNLYNPNDENSGGNPEYSSLLMPLFKVIENELIFMLDKYESALKIKIKERLEDKNRVLKDQAVKLFKKILKPKEKIRLSIYDFYLLLKNLVLENDYQSSKYSFLEQSKDDLVSENIHIIDHMMRLNFLRNKIAHTGIIKSIKEFEFNYLNLILLLSFIVELKS